MILSFKRKNSPKSRNIPKDQCEVLSYRPKKKRRQSKKSLNNITIKEVYRAIIRYIPSRLGIALRSKYYEKYFGSYVRIKEGVIISKPENIRFGVECFINQYTRIYGTGSVKIGNYVMIGNHVTISSADHNFNRLDIPMKHQGYTKGSVIIENDVWIGAHAVITKDVVIGEGSVVGAGAIVTKNVEPYTIVGGVPAMKIRSHLDNTDVSLINKEEIAEVSIPLV